MSEIAITPTTIARHGASIWLRLLLIIIGLALVVAIPFAVWILQQDLPPLTVMIGDSQVHQVQLGVLSHGQRLAVVAAVFAAVVAVLIAVPLVIVVVCATVLVSVVLGVGLPLVIVAGITFLLLSPLLLLMALARWIWRASAARAPLPGAAVNG